MVDLKTLQQAVYQNKVAHGFNTTNVEFEFCLAYGELGEELADVAIYLLGISEILGIDLEQEILQKMEKNRKRTYKKVGDEYIKEEG